MTDTNPSNDKKTQNWQERLNNSRKKQGLTWDEFVRGRASPTKKDLMLQQLQIQQAMLVELHRLNSLLAPDSEADNQQMYECDHCGTVVPGDMRQEHLIDAHNAPTDIALDSQFSVTEPVEANNA